MDPKKNIILIRVYEGPDGAGKSTLINKEKTRLQSKGMKVIVCRTPNTKDEFKERLKYWRSIINRTNKSIIILMDRFTPISSMVYQEDNIKPWDTKDYRSWFNLIIPAADIILQLTLVTCAYETHMKRLMARGDKELMTKYNKTQLREYIFKISNSYQKLFSSLNQVLHSFIQIPNIKIGRKDTTND